MEVTQNGKLLECNLEESIGLDSAAHSGFLGTCIFLDFLKMPLNSFAHLQEEQVKQACNGDRALFIDPCTIDKILSFIIIYIKMISYEFLIRFCFHFLLFMQLSISSMFIWDFDYFSNNNAHYTAVYQHRRVMS